MSEAAHTPGPWKWWTSNSWRRLKRDDRGITMNVLEPYVCRDGCPDLTITEADMSLIAAAPDLLGALKDLHADCVEYARINNLHNSDGSPATHHAMRRAAAAIALAEGRAP